MGYTCWPSISRLGCATKVVSPRVDYNTICYMGVLNPKADLELLKDAAAEALGWKDEELDGLVKSRTPVDIENEQED